MFARHCLLPCLALQIREPDLFLDSIIKKYCVLPLLQSHNSDEDAKTIIQVILVQLEQYQQDSKRQLTDGRKSIRRQIKEGLPLLIKLVGQLCTTELASKKKFFAHWFEQLFLQLAGYMDVEISADKSMMLSIQQSEFLANLLLAYQSVGQDPGEATLSTLVLSCDASTSEPFSTQPWRIIKLCLEIRPSIVHTALQTELVRAHVLSQIDIVDIKITVATLEMEKVNAAVFYLLEPLLEASMIGCSLLAFIPEWQACIERTLPVSLKMDNRKAIKKQRELFWEYDSVRTAIQCRISKSVNSTNLHDLIIVMLKDLHSITSHRKNTSKFYSHMIMWPTIIGSYFGTCTAVNSAVSEKRNANIEWVMPLYNIITAYYLKHQQYGGGYLILELLTELRSSMSSESEEIIWSANKELFANANSIIETALTDTVSQGDYECASAAWSLLGLWLCDTQYKFVEKFLQPTFVSLWHTINKQLKQIWKTEIEGSELKRPHLLFINTGRFNLRNYSDFLYASITDIMVFPRFLDVLGSTDVESLVQNLFACAFLSNENEEGKFTKDSSKNDSLPPYSWRTLWSALVSSEAVAESSTLYQAIHKTRITSFIDGGQALLGSYTAGTPMELQFYEFILGEFDHVKSKLISKEERGKMMNKITNHLERATLDKAPISPSLRLISRLMKSPTKSASLVADSRIIWVLGSSLENHLNIEDVDNLRLITRAITKYWIQDGKASKAIIESFLEHLAQRIARASEYTIKTGIATIIVTALSVFDSSDDYKSMIGEATHIKFLECQLQQFSAINGNKIDPSMEILGLLHNISSMPATVLKNFDWLQQTSIICGNSTLGAITIRDYLHQKDEALFALISNKDSEGQDDMTVYCWSCSKRLLALVDDNDEQSAQFSGLEISCFSFEAGIRRLHKIRNDFRHLSSDRKARALDLTTSSDKMELEISRLRHLRELLLYSFSLNERTTALRAALENVFESILQQMEEPSRSKYFLPYFKIIQAILLHNPWITKQEHIDRTLIMITILTSQSCKVLNFTASKGSLLHLVIHSSVNLLKIIFQNHRPKIGGRWHLVIDALKGILRCLFVPYPGLNSKEMILQPGWLLDQDSSVVKEAHVVLLSRLLSSICNPTHKTLKSNMKVSHSRTVLNDATKSARAISGQHMQHFVGEFCSLQLRGKMLHQDAIKPGLYTIFDAMSQDVKRSLNEGLDPQARIMFKNLYDEWMRFGKWTGN